MPLPLPNSLSPFILLFISQTSPPSSSLTSNAPFSASRKISNFICFPCFSPYFLFYSLSNFIILFFNNKIKKPSTNNVSLLLRIGKFEEVKKVIRDQPRQHAVPPYPHRHSPAHRTQERPDDPRGVES